MEERHRRPDKTFARQFKDCSKIISIISPLGRGVEEYTETVLRH